ncbi:phosphatidate cytidylyltransferase [Rhizobium sp. R72]|uniref:phosphatidate cytidylyltransferase n=1 Tax=unclassified Rhizobium TaxID=2613769 RepID=UPI000B52DB9B|nr:MULTISPECIES: phosphatidate cytidylyltransferase [unclassified Rhizobium]OWV94367.1 phosphatidate cytidylyltransferase [Rhizobium sp. R72]OWV94637.1 phosphatidate cytidylyltransferase [Rhizobium sp. R711]OWV99132.1 phosphatidate cytidylyltransferase [Rhizobium sp. R693]
MQQELKLRIVSGVILAAIVLLATWYGGVAFSLLSALIGLLIYYEWSTITKLATEQPVANAVGWIGQAAIAVAVVAGTLGYSLLLLVLFFLIAVGFVFTLGVSRWFPTGAVYAGLTGIALSTIRGADSVGLVAMLFVFAVVWSTDILAYFVGRAIGGPKLAPKISPGKTWSGAIGGAVSAVIAGSLVAYFAFPESVVLVAPVAFILSVCSQSGDLFESFIKRRFGVKDSSHLIPGHGGVMDRVDGLIFACFAAFLLAVLFSLIKGGEITSLGAALFGV